MKSPTGLIRMKGLPSVHEAATRWANPGAPGTANAKPNTTFRRTIQAPLPRAVITQRPAGYAMAGVALGGCGGRGPR